MFPNRAIDILRSAPGLRSKFEDVGADTFAWYGLDQLSTIDGILRVDVAVERSFGLSEKRGAGKQRKCETTEAH